jgi:iron complex outermembrane receptor protein
VLNSRENGYYFKAGCGFERKNWTQYNYYDFSYNQYGFILDGLGNPMTPDERNTRKMSGPHHNVLLNFFSSRNQFELGANSRLNVNLGFQSTKRAEGSGSISLNIHLLSILQNAAFRHQVAKGLTLIVYQSVSQQVNTNYGKRVLIPDANLLELNGSAGLIYEKRKWSTSLVIGPETKQIRTLTTGSFNSIGSEVPPTSRTMTTMTGAAHASYSPSDQLRIKFDLSTGYRAPNLAELATNGVHEGTFQFEIGDPKMHPEQALNSSVTVGYATVKKRRMEVAASVTGYRYQFKNYIYLSPTSEFRNVFYRVYRYRQQDANLHGADGTLTLRWNRLSNHSPIGELKMTGSCVQGIKSDQSYLPFIPAGKLSSRLSYFIPETQWMHHGFVGITGDYSFAQQRPALFETRTSDYLLIGLVAGSRFGNSEISSKFRLYRKKLA